MSPQDLDIPLPSLDAEEMNVSGSEPASICWRHVVLHAYTVAVGLKVDPLGGWALKNYARVPKHSDIIPLSRRKLIERSDKKDLNQ